jgi:hypothetical protein
MAHYLDLSRRGSDFVLRMREGLCAEKGIMKQNENPDAGLFMVMRDLIRYAATGCLHRAVRTLFRQVFLAEREAAVSCKSKNRKMKLLIEELIVDKAFCLAKVTASHDVCTMSCKNFKQIVSHGCLTQVLELFNSKLENDMHCALRKF